MMEIMKILTKIDNKLVVSSLVFVSSCYEQDRQSLYYAHDSALLVMIRLAWQSTMDQTDQTFDQSDSGSDRSGD